jgi:uncharacterized protein (TIGR02145 family)
MTRVPFALLVSSALAVSACSSSSTSPDGLPCAGTPTVSDGTQTYDTVRIGTQCWMQQNLNVGTMVPSSQTQVPANVEKYCYDDDADSCHVWGGLYQWAMAMNGSTTEGARGICPAGWHVPTLTEWQTLASYVGGATVAGQALKASGTSLWLDGNVGTDAYNFSLLPAGACFGSSFLALTADAVVWTSHPITTPPSDNNATARYTLYDQSLLVEDDNLRTFAFSVRCLQDG